MMKKNFLLSKRKIKWSEWYNMLVFLIEINLQKKRIFPRRQITQYREGKQLSRTENRRERKENIRKE